MLKTSLLFISLNTRGLRDHVKRKAVFLFCKGQKAHCTFLQETHSGDADATFWSNQWGEKILFSHGSNRSGGVAICFDKCPGKVVAFKADKAGHWLAVVLNIDETFVILVNVYGYNNTNQNKLLLSDVTDVIYEYKERFHTEFILTGGDFNLTPDEWRDRYPSKYSSTQWNTVLFDFVNPNNLMDIWRDRNPNTYQFS